MLLNQVAGRGDGLIAAARYERQAGGVPKTMGDPPNGGDDLVAALVGRVLRLQQQISELAGDAADTEQQLALVCRRLAEQNPARSAVYFAAAREADRYSAHKREEQRRWQLT